MSNDDRKELVWIGSSRRDLKEMPEDVQDVFGRALLDAQYGEKPVIAKVLRGYNGGAVLELIEDHDGDTYRAVYTVRFEGLVYVLHAFQKKSKRGGKTAQHDKDLINQRLAAAGVHYQRRKAR